jgi:hypothetical protein
MLLRKRGANMGQIWGSSFGPARALSQAGSLTKFSYLVGSHDTSPMGPSGHGSRFTSRRQSRSITPSSQRTDGDLEKDNVRVEVTEVKDEFEDPEAANQGHAKRPMILTHSVMVGLTLILLLAVESIVISKVLSSFPLTYGPSN